MKMKIETNTKHGEGYQVRVYGEDVETTVIDYGPYTLKKAVAMAGKALEIFNRKVEYKLDLRDVLEIDRDSVASNEEYDELSRKMADMIGESDMDGEDGIRTASGDSEISG